MRSNVYFALLSFILVLYGTSGISVQLKQSEYAWVVMDQWSSCSATCGVGRQHKEMVCIKMLLYSESVVADDYCKSVKMPPEIVRDCNHGNCIGTYVWRPSKWSECSQTCGNSGRRSRDVECVYDDGTGNFVTSDSPSVYCETSLRPETSSSCNNFDCPPKFIPGSWEKCIKSRQCLPGKQRRSLDCIGILKNGKPKKMPRNACYKESLPPVSWRKCNDYINTEECLKYNKRIPEIETKTNTLVQMRKSKKLKIQIGQTAYVLLYTKVVLICPVNFFLSRELLWKHQSTTYKFSGKQKGRIKVDKKGRLRIAKFQLEDQGSWTCIAGTSNASTILKSRNPSEGYEDWILRTSLWNREMFNEDPESGLVRQEVFQWIQKSWSGCSLSCGGEGIQTREVHCEEIDTRHYNILSDDVCEKRGQKKPETKRVCQRLSQCPTWSLVNYDVTQCTEKCLGVGVAQVKGNLSCIYQDKEIQHSACNVDLIPRMECPNSKCQVMWKRSKWSQCSVSCGGTGIMARYLMCVWKTTEEPAGSLCYKANLFVPQVIKPCLAPKCNLKCVDLSSNCQRREKFCKLSMYRFTCCSTCFKSYLKSKSQKRTNDVVMSTKQKRKYRHIKKIVRNKKKNKLGGWRELNY